MAESAAASRPAIKRRLGIEACFIRRDRLCEFVAHFAHSCRSAASILCISVAVPAASADQLSFFKSSGSLAMFAATRRASSFVNRPISNRRVGFSSSK